MCKKNDLNVIFVSFCGVHSLFANSECPNPKPQAPTLLVQRIGGKYVDQIDGLLGYVDFLHRNRHIFEMSRFNKGARRPLPACYSKINGYKSTMFCWPTASNNSSFKLSEYSSSIMIEVINLLSKSLDILFSATHTTIFSISKTNFLTQYS